MEEYSRIKRARMDKTDELQGNVEADHELAQTTLSSAYNDVETFASSVTSGVSTLGDLSSKHLEAVRRNVDVLQKNARAVLDKGAREDELTGETPQKRSWEYPEEWELAHSRDEILGEFRGAQAALVEAAKAKSEAAEAQPHASAQQHKRPSTSTSDIENAVPAILVEEVMNPPPPPSGLPTFPAKTRESLKEKRQSTLATETLVDSRKRNVSTRSRR
jgi:kinesin family member 11